MVHPAALAISFGVVLGGAIFALFYYNSNRNSSNQYRYEERPRSRPDPFECIRNQLELDMCSICLERFDNEEVFLECHHRFHPQCIQQSLQHSDLCPNCRATVKVLRS